MSKNEKIAGKLRDYAEKTRLYIVSLRDVRNIGTLAFLILTLLVSWSGLHAIQTNYTLQRQVNRMEQENEIKRLENDNLEMSNKYYETSQYLDVAARQNLGVAAPGETVILVPKEVALAHTFPMRDKDEVKLAEQKLPFLRRNFEAWMDFFLHRNARD